MAASTVTRAPINDTDANFRLWGKAISDALAAAGLVKTSDTGQIDWTTVTRPTLANTAQGYEIWRSNDASGSLHNWYLKIEYGSGAAANTPSLWVTIGWGSNGSGTLSGNTNTRVQCNLATSSSSLFNCNFAGGTGWICFGLFLSGTGINLCLSIERTRTVAGAEQDEVFVYCAGFGTATKINQVVPYSGTVGTNNTAGTTALALGTGWLAPIAATAGYGANNGVGMLFPQKGAFQMPSLNLLCGDTTTYSAAQVQYSVSMYGATHNYINSFRASDVNPSAGSILTRYE